MATNFGTKIAINWLCVDDSDYAIGPSIHSTRSNQLKLHFLFTELTGSNHNFLSSAFFVFKINHTFTSKCSVPS